MSTTPLPEGAQPAATPSTPAAAPVVYYYPPTPPRRSFWGWLAAALSTFFLLGSVGLNLILIVALAMGVSGLPDADRRVQEKYVSHNAQAPDKVAVIAIEGTILNTEDGFVKRQIDQVMKDGRVKAVVLRVNSPGGSVSGSDYLYHHLVELREKRGIPIVVSMGGIAASGGYYVAMAVGHAPDTIIAEPTGFTGSIGVLIPHYNMADLLKNKIGIEDDSVASNPLKLAGTITKPLEGKEREIFQTLVDESFAQFKGVIRQGRARFDADPTALDRLATGQIYTAQQAKDNGLIDKIGFVEDAVDRAIALASLDPSNVKVVRYKPEPSLSTILTGSESRGATAVDLEALLEMTTPRAYYLCTWLPGVGSQK